MYKLFMEFENPTKAFVGAKKSIQGFSVAGDLGFVLYHTGILAVYDLVSRDPKPIGVCKLGSYNAGDPDKRYINHANDAMFGAIMDGEEFPLLYVTAGNSGECDEKGYIAYCAVEQIRRENGIFTSETVQRIYYKNDGIEETGFHTPGWGWPASLVNVEGGYYYMFSAKYRTKKEFYQPDNVYTVTKFALPDPKAGDVTLTPRDILSQFDLPFDIFITQGGTLKDGRIYYMFGFGTEEYPDAMRVIDLDSEAYLLSEDLSNTLFACEEVECCAFYEGRLLINTQAGKLYERF